MSDQLFSETLLGYINTTTPELWARIDPGYTHYFSKPSLDAALTDLENQLGAASPTPPSRDTQRIALGTWIGDVTLAQLQQRVNAMNSQYQTLAGSTRAADTVTAWSYTAAVSSRCNDITFLGVYLYGLGIADGLYDEKSSNP